VGPFIIKQKKRRHHKLDIEQLKQLQDVDIQIANVYQERNELEQTLKSDEEAYRDAENTIVEFNKNYEQLESEKKAKEAEIQQTTEMIKRWDTRLKEAKSGREYQAFMREINGAKRDIDEIENAVLKIMEELDKIDKSRGEEKKKIEEIGKRLQQTSEQNKNRVSLLTKEIQKLELQKDSIAKNITPAMLSMYEQIKKQRDIAIVGVKKSICQGCHVNIPPQLFNEVIMNNRIILCPHCQRILYYVEENEAAEQKPKRNKKAV
jgi:predicted  nucleic acid-binding Zn-ribbon protein